MDDKFEDVESVEGDPTEGLDLRVLQTFVEDNPDIRIPYRDEDYRDGKIDVDWYADDNGNVHVSLKAEAVIHIDEIGGDDGPVYVSRLFKGRKGKLKDAIGLALRNEINRTFLKMWAEKNPAQRNTSPAEAASLEGENKKLRQELEERERKLADLLGADWNANPKAAGGQPAPSSAASRGSKGADGRSDARGHLAS